MSGHKALRSLVVLLYLYLWMEMVGDTTPVHSFVGRGGVLLLFVRFMYIRTV